MSDQLKTIPFPVTPELEAMRRRTHRALRETAFTATVPQPAYVMTIEGRSDDAVPQALINGQWIDVEDVRFRLQEGGGE